MTDGVIDLGIGVTLEPLTDAAVDYVNAHLRIGDRMEQDVFGVEAKRGDFERAWTVMDEGNIVGFIGFLPLACESILSRRRFLAGLTTEYANRVKVKLVRRYKQVVRAVLNQMPPYVDEVYTKPLTAYTGAIRVLSDVVGFRVIGFDYDYGHLHTVMMMRKGR